MLTTEMNLPNDDFYNECLAYDDLEWISAIFN